MSGTADPRDDAAPAAGSRPGSSPAAAPGVGAASAAPGPAAAPAAPAATAPASPVPLAAGAGPAGPAPAAPPLPGPASVPGFPAPAPGWRPAPDGLPVSSPAWPAPPPTRPASPAAPLPPAAWPPAASTAHGQPTLTRARVGSLVRGFLRSPVEAATWLALFAILLGFGVAVIAISLLSFLFSTGGSLLIWLVGIPIVALGIEASRLIAREERWRMTLVDGRPLVAHLYRPYDGLPRSPYGAWLRAWGETQFLDVNRWRDVVYVLVLFPLAMLELGVVLVLWSAALVLIMAPAVVAVLSTSGAFERISDRLGVAAGAVIDVSGSAFAASLFALLVGLLLVPVASSTGRGLMRLHRAVVAGLLCVDPTVALRQDVERLRGSRSAALELEASELRRIERDLHDGAQQRLVMLSIDLGLAEDRLASDPDSARQLVADAREQARLALAELRDLVRGTAPSILLDRGLVAALGAVAGNCPVPTTVDSGLADGQRLPASVERAAYFVVAESLANVAKHSGASHASVTLRLMRGGSAVAGAADVAGTLGEPGTASVPAAAEAAAVPGAAAVPPAPAVPGSVAVPPVPEAAAAVWGTVSPAAPGAPGSPGVPGSVGAPAHPVVPAAPGEHGSPLAGASSGSAAPGGPWRPMWPAGPASTAAPGASTSAWPQDATAPTWGGAAWPQGAPSWAMGASDRHVAPAVLVVEVADDGAGGAAVTPGGGLAGLRDRVEALDGRLTLSSPPGGPTVVRVEIPVVS